MRQITSQEELEELHAAAGLVYNDFSGRGAGGDLSSMSGILADSSYRVLLA